jgi:hypothetical protein
MEICRTAVELNKEVIDNIQITSQEHMILKSMEKFYMDDVNIKFFMNITSSFAQVSIRLIDYFITKYSKIYKISYKYNDDIINVFSSYKQQLKAYQKKHFDPFSRGERIPYFMGDICVITTIGQLNFFRWFISKNILDYIVKNQLAIECDMNQKNKVDKKITKIGKDRKKKYKSVIASTKPTYSNDIKQCLKTNNIVVSFN